ncbi:4Fe-4S dicluster-binding protein [Methanocorpusculum vombati]|uniref:4Fe-4S binding protein n=1 Tax=Methanocorpusculum vombati TaxID=3002864 RepID=A0ABT4ILZ1_9EURY|nr:4Fe-4S dicluster-binding protein [Methanocorpusculum vombati]MCZ9319881.1 4Fe-4S binding protein [Methanocorpusculum sp.]MCZ0862762.1 4Fe-4S binding protein [Methanocorpusculum vombati]MDE2520629.1 4Fe-4S binding protein [Methanocorpusculum sp.]MDE2534166.1 4Fe-4S binding protein [Methanocorpusculum sp.]MDE2545410.1 4Fe-4S binding protein [Methanocorpusculum sp.]
MQVARVKKEKCSTADCNRCIRFCPVSRKDQPVIYIGRNKKATVNEELCNGCAKCVRICPEKAIEMITIPDPVDETVVAAAEVQSPDTAATPAPAAEVPKQTAPPKKKETPEEKIVRKKAEHSERVIRTLIACVLGMIAGIASYFIAGTPNPETGTQADPFVGVLILLVAIVLQRTIFILIRIDTAKLGKKDWFYQAFMTFAMWYLSWTIILSTSLLAE